ncbi:kynureninase [Oceanobacillus sp. FSL H7-0719]|uniref:kynureninase n=1 Tax=Oceanobacillus sp. FSL H7-0719 TaxID=2954507 RepID=UPI00324C44D4
MSTGRSVAKKLDSQDELRHFRDEFYVSSEQIYLDGNSLGLLSKRAEKSLYTLLDSWKNYGIDGWTAGAYPWFYLSEQLGALTASLIGAKPEEVITTGSTTTNLHQLLATFFKPKDKRNKILADELNFPSDIYAIKSQLSLKNLNPDEHLIQVKSRDGNLLQEEDIIAAMTEDIAVIILPSVLYRSGQLLDMQYLTEEAHQRNILIGFDLCHSIGAIPHHLSEAGVDFAFWCTYKHLNGGPGSVGGIYVNERHSSAEPGLAGWFGSAKEKQFDMEHTFTPAADAGAYQIGTPHVLSIAPLLGSLEIFQEAKIDKIREKSLQLTAFFIELLDSELPDATFTNRSPVSKEKRGPHIYLEHPEAASICKALKARNVIPDFRTPNGIRLAPVALYNTFEDVYEAVRILSEIMKSKEYKNFKNERGVIA